MYCLVYILVVTVIFANARKLPPYIKPCRSDDPNLNECAKQHAISAVPYIVKGDKEYKIPVMSPLNIPLITLNPAPDFTFTFKNISLYGFDTVQVEDYRINLEKKHGEVILFVKKLVFEGQYEMKGRILVIPIEGKGPAKITCDDMFVNYPYDYKLITQNGKEYIDESSLSGHLTYNVTNIAVDFGNLFNGDKNLGDRTNEFLNEHALEINKEFGSTISQTIELISSDIFKKILLKVPYDEIFIS